MLNDYGCPWPFFGPEGPLEDDELPLGPELTAKVRAWAQSFAAEYDEQRGWPSLARRQQALAEGLALSQEVQQVVEPDMHVQFEFWETRVDGQDLPMRGVSCGDD